MTENEAIEILEERWRYSKTYKYTDTEIREAFELAIKALEAQPCEDCISREKAIKQCGFGMTSLLIADCLRKLPSVQPTRPTARWERLVDDFKKCSKCGRPVKSYRNYKHCPECGARMEEVEE